MRRIYAINGTISKRQMPKINPALHIRAVEIRSRVPAKPISERLSQALLGREMQYGQLGKVDLVT